MNLAIIHADKVEYRKVYGSTICRYANDETPPPGRPFPNPRVNAEGWMVSNHAPYMMLLTYNEEC